MKKVIYIITILFSIIVLCFALAGCNPQLTTDKQLLWNWPEDGSETFTYSITNNSVEQGTLTLKVISKKEGDKYNYTITRDQTMSNGDTVNGKVLFSNTSKDFAFPPIESVCTSKINGVTKTYKIEYLNDKITYYSSDSDAIPDNAQGKTFKHKMPYYDNMQFYTILRGAKFDNKFNLSFNLFIPAEEVFCTLSCALGVSENLSYKLAGQQKLIDCQLINIYRSQKIPGDPIKLYYAKNDIDVGERKVKQALVKFIERDYVYSLTNIEVA